MKLSKGKIRRLLKKRKESKSNNYKRKKGKIAENTKNNKKKRHLANKSIHNKRSKITILNKADKNEVAKKNNYVMKQKGGGSREDNSTRQIGGTESEKNLLNTIIKAHNRSMLITIYKMRAALLAERRFWSSAGTVKDDGKSVGKYIVNLESKELDANALMPAFLEASKKAKTPLVVVQQQTNVAGWPSRGEARPASRVQGGGVKTTPTWKKPMAGDVRPDPVGPFGKVTYYLLNRSKTVVPPYVGDEMEKKSGDRINKFLMSYNVKDKGRQTTPVQDSDITRVNPSVIKCKFGDEGGKNFDVNLGARYTDGKAHIYIARLIDGGKHQLPVEEYQTVKKINDQGPMSTVHAAILIYETRNNSTELIRGCLDPLDETRIGIMEAIPESAFKKHNQSQLIRRAHIWAKRNVSLLDDYGPLRKSELEDLRNSVTKDLEAYAKAAGVKLTEVEDDDPAPDPALVAEKADQLTDDIFPDETIHKIEDDMTQLLLLSTLDNWYDGSTRKKKTVSPSHVALHWWANTEFLLKPEIEWPGPNNEELFLREYYEKSYNKLATLNEAGTELTHEKETLNYIDAVKFAIKAGYKFTKPPSKKEGEQHTIEFNTMLNGIIASRRLESDGNHLVGQTVRIISGKAEGVIGVVERVDPVKSDNDYLGDYNYKITINRLTDNKGIIQEDLEDNHENVNQDKPSINQLFANIWNGKSKKEFSEASAANANPENELIVVDEMEVEVAADHLSEMWARELEKDELTHAQKFSAEAKKYYDDHFNAQKRNHFYAHGAEEIMAHETGIDNYNRVRNIAEIASKSLYNIFPERFTQDAKDMYTAAKFNLVYAESYVEELKAVKRLFDARIAFVRKAYQVEKQYAEKNIYQNHIRAITTAMKRDENSKKKLSVVQHADLDAAAGELINDPGAREYDENAVATTRIGDMSDAVVKKFANALKKLMDAQKERKRWYDKMSDLRHSRRKFYIERGYFKKKYSIHAYKYNKLRQQYIPAKLRSVRNIGAVGERFIIDKIAAKIQEKSGKAPGALWGGDRSAERARNKAVKDYTDALQEKLEDNLINNRKACNINVDSYKNDLITLSKCRNKMEKSGVIPIADLRQLVPGGGGFSGGTSRDAPRKVMSPEELATLGTEKDFANERIKVIQNRWSWRTKLMYHKIFTHIESVDRTFFLEKEKGADDTKTGKKEKERKEQLMEASKKDKATLKAQWKEEDEEEKEGVDRILDIEEATSNDSGKTLKALYRSGLMAAELFAKLSEPIIRAKAEKWFIEHVKLEKPYPYILALNLPIRLLENLQYGNFVREFPDQTPGRYIENAEGTLPGKGLYRDYLGEMDLEYIKIVGVGTTKKDYRRKDMEHGDLTEAQSEHREGGRGFWTDNVVVAEDRSWVRHSYRVYNAPKQYLSKPRYDEDHLNLPEDNLLKHPRNQMYMFNYDGGREAPRPDLSRQIDDEPVYSDPEFLKKQDPQQKRDKDDAFPDAPMLINADGTLDDVGRRAADAPHAGKEANLDRFAKKYGVAALARAVLQNEIMRRVLDQKKQPLKGQGAEEILRKLCWGMPMTRGLYNKTVTDSARAIVNKIIKTSRKAYIGYSTSEIMDSPRENELTLVTYPAPKEVINQGSAKSISWMQQQRQQQQQQQKESKLGPDIVIDKKFTVTDAGGNEDKQIAPLRPENRIKNKLYFKDKIYRFSIGRPVHYSPTSLVEVGQIPRRSEAGLWEFRNDLVSMIKRDGFGESLGQLKEEISDTFDKWSRAVRARGVGNEGWLSYYMKQSHEDLKRLGEKGADRMLYVLNPSNIQKLRDSSDSRGRDDDKRDTISNANLLKYIKFDDANTLMYGNSDGEHGFMAGNTNHMATPMNSMNTLATQWGPIVNKSKRAADYGSPGKDLRVSRADRQTKLDAERDLDKREYNSAQFDKIISKAMRSDDNCNDIIFKNNSMVNVLNLKPKPDSTYEHSFVESTVNKLFESNNDLNDLFDAMIEKLGFATSKEQEPEGEREEEEEEEKEGKDESEEDDDDLSDPLAHGDVDEDPEDGGLPGPQERGEDQHLNKRDKKKAAHSIIGQSEVGKPSGNNGKLSFNLEDPYKRRISIRKHLVDSKNETRKSSLHSLDKDGILDDILDLIEDDDKKKIQKEKWDNEIFEYKTEIADFINKGFKFYSARTTKPQQKIEFKVNAADDSTTSQAFQKLIEENLIPRLRKTLKLPQESNVDDGTPAVITLTGQNKLTSMRLRSESNDDIKDYLENFKKTYAPPLSREETMWWGHGGGGGRRGLVGRGRGDRRAGGTGDRQYGGGTAETIFMTTDAGAAIDEDIIKKEVNDWGNNPTIGTNEEEFKPDGYTDGKFNYVNDSLTKQPIQTIIAKLDASQDESDVSIAETKKILFNTLKSKDIDAKIEYIPPFELDKLPKDGLSTKGKSEREALIKKMAKEKKLSETVIEDLLKKTGGNEEVARYIIELVNAQKSDVDEDVDVSAKLREQLDDEDNVKVIVDKLLKDVPQAKKAELEKIRDQAKLNKNRRIAIKAAMGTLHSPPPFINEGGQEAQSARKKYIEANNALTNAQTQKKKAERELKVLLKLDEHERNNARVKELNGEIDKANVEIANAMQAMKEAEDPLVDAHKTHTQRRGRARGRSARQTGAPETGSVSGSPPRTRDGEDDPDHSAAADDDGGGEEEEEEEENDELVDKKKEGGPDQNKIKNLEDMIRVLKKEISNNKVASSNDDFLVVVQIDDDFRKRFRESKKFMTLQIPPENEGEEPTLFNIKKPKTIPSSEYLLIKPPNKGDKEREAIRKEYEDQIDELNKKLTAAEKAAQKGINLCKLVKGQTGMKEILSKLPVLGSMIVSDSTTEEQDKILKNARFKDKIKDIKLERRIKEREEYDKKQEAKQLRKIALRKQKQSELNEVYAGEAKLAERDIEMEKLITQRASSKNDDSVKMREQKHKEQMEKNNARWGQSGGSNKEQKNKAKTQKTKKDLYK